MQEDATLELTRPDKNNNAEILITTSTPFSYDKKSTVSDCPDAYAKWYCLNGATCFSVQIHDAALYNCWCPQGFHGLRCEYKYLGSQRLEQQQLHEIGTESTDMREHYRGTSSNSLDLIQAQGDRAKHNRYEAMIGRPTNATKALHLIIYNLLILFLAIILIAIILRYVRRKASANATAEGIVSDSSQARQALNGQINHDSVSIRLDMSRQEQQQHLHHENQIPTELQHRHAAEIHWHTPIRAELASARQLRPKPVS